MINFKIRFNAPVTLTFVLISLFSLLFGYFTNFNSTSTMFITYRSSLTDPLFYIRLITYIFGHTDWSHFMSNMTYILLLGPLIEEKYGSKNMIFMILITAVISGLANALFFDKTGLCGASGIVFMLMVISSVTSVSSKEIPLTLILVLAIFVGTEIYQALFVIDSISQLTHIIGGICGAVFGLQFHNRVGGNK